MKKWQKDPDDRGPWLQTYTGKRFHILDPREDEFDIEDTAHSLAGIHRFNAHTNRYVSVGEHCLAMSYLVEPEDMLEALLHELEEPIVGDVPQPLKWALHLLAPGVLYEIKHQICIVGARKYGLKYPWSAKIKEMDLRLLVTERNLLMTRHNALWDVDESKIEPAPFDYPAVAPDPRIVEAHFLDRYEELKRERECSEVP